MRESSVRSKRGKGVRWGHFPQPGGYSLWLQAVGRAGMRDRTT